MDISVQLHNDQITKYSHSRRATINIHTYIDKNNVCNVFRISCNQITITNGTSIDYMYLVLCMYIVHTNEFVHFPQIHSTQLIKYVLDCFCVDFSYFIHSAIETIILSHFKCVSPLIVPLLTV